ncbi:MAG: hypothetical protein Fur0010_17170 [Bdellovibrio sp.]
MAVKDLNIEFEDEDDIKKAEEERKKKASVVQDVELDFDVLTDPNVPEGDVKKALEQTKTQPMAKGLPTTKPQVATKPQAAPAPQAEVKPIRPQPAAAPAPAPVASAQPQVVSANYQLGDELKKIMNGNQILQIELEARIKIEVAERMAILKAEQAQENKMLERDVTRILKQIVAKAPALKKEVMQLQKIVQDFAIVDKSKKKNSGSGEDAA